MESINKSLNEAKELLEKLIDDKNFIDNIAATVDLMADSIKKGNKIISCGNGGSMSDAMHFAEEMTGKFRGERPSLPAIAISDPSHLTCAGNDYGFDGIFSRYIESIGQKGDILLAISTSGNSGNVINAALAAANKSMKIIALTGRDGGKLSEIADIEIRIPHFGYSDRIQEMHIKVIHIIIESIEHRLLLTKP